jgi:hypothetical protein
MTYLCSQGLAWLPTIYDSCISSLTPCRNGSTALSAPRNGPNRGRHNALDLKEVCSYISASGSQPIVSLQLGQVFSACLIAFGIAGPRGGREVELSRQEVQKFCRRRFIGLQRTSRVPQECELNCKTQTILGPSPATDQAEVLIAEDVNARSVRRDQLGSLQGLHAVRTKEAHVAPSESLPLADDGFVACPR